MHELCQHGPAGAATHPSLFPCFMTCRTQRVTPALVWLAAVPTCSMLLYH